MAMRQECASPSSWGVTPFAPVFPTFSHPDSMVPCFMRTTQLLQGSMTQPMQPRFLEQLARTGQVDQIQSALLRRAFVRPLANLSGSQSGSASFSASQPPPGGHVRSQ